MNWEAIGVIAELVGAVAVVISLGYLAIQVRSNTRALKASSSFDSTHSWAATNELLVSAITGDSNFQTGGNSRLVDISAKFYNPETKPGDMTDTEIVLMSMVHRVLFQKLEGQFYQYKHGYAEPKIWIARLSITKKTLPIHFTHSSSADFPNPQAVARSRRQRPVRWPPARLQGGQRRGRQT